MRPYSVRHVPLCLLCFHRAFPLLIYAFSFFVVPFSFRFPFLFFVSLFCRYIVFVFLFGASEYVLLSFDMLFAFLFFSVIFLFRCFLFFFVYYYVLFWCVFLCVYCFLLDNARKFKAPNARGGSSARAAHALARTASWDGVAAALAVACLAVRVGGVLVVGLVVGVRHLVVPAAHPFEFDGHDDPAILVLGVPDLRGQEGPADEECDEHGLER